MRDALRSAGRPIVFSLCEWGSNKPWLWAKDVGHLWRTTGDIYKCFDCVKNYGTWNSWGVMQILDMQDGLRKYAGPDHWNDPDMMEVGNGMSVGEDRAHFSMWCMLAAPLMCGNDLRNMTIETKLILTNKEMIAINQDPLGIQGFRHSVNDSVETWLKPLKDGMWAICYLNRSKTTKNIELDWKTLNIKDELSGRELNTTGNELFKILDIWNPKKPLETKKPLKMTIPGHDVVCLKLYK